MFLLVGPKTGASLEGETLELDFTRCRLAPDLPRAEDASGDVSVELEAEEDTGFDWDMCQPGEMLIFSPDDLPALFDAAITDPDPVRPRNERSLPANAIFFASRFAFALGQNGLLDDLLLGQ